MTPHKRSAYCSFFSHDTQRSACCTTRSASYTTHNFHDTQLLRHATSSSTRNTQRWTFFSTSTTRNFYDTHLLLPRTQLIRHATSTTRNFFSHARHLALCILLLLLPRHSTLCILLLLIPRHAALCLMFDTLCFLYDSQLPRHATSTTRNSFSHARHLALCILLLLLPRQSRSTLLGAAASRMTRSALHIAVYFFSYEDRHNKAALCILLLTSSPSRTRHHKRSAYRYLLLPLRGWSQQGSALLVVRHALLLIRHATSTTRNFHDTQLLLPRTQRSACCYCFSHNTQRSAYCCLLLLLRGLVTTSALHIAIYFFSYEDRHNKAALCILLFTSSPTRSRHHKRSAYRYLLLLLRGSSQQGSALLVATASRRTRSALHIAAYFFSYEDSSPQALCISLFTSSPTRIVTTR